MKIDHSILRFISLLIAAMSIYLGYDLFIKGVSGEASLVLNSKTLSGQLINAAPGLFFVLSGVLITFFALYRKIEEYRPMARIVARKHQDKKGDPSISDPASKSKITVRKTSEKGSEGGSVVLEVEDLGDMEYLEIPAFLRRQSD